MVAKLPPDRHVSVGAIRYTHDDGVLRVVGEPKAGGKPEVQEKKVGLGVAARYLAAYDAAIAAQYPKWDTSGREPPELWIALDSASKAATMAEKLDVGARSPHDAAKLLRSFMPKAGGIVATKTTMEQIQAFAGIAKAVTDGDPKKNLVDLEEKVLNAQGSSLLEAMKRDVSGTFPTLTWITTAAGFSMDQDARRAASDITRDFGDVIAAQATVIETGGFQGAAVRMIISGMDLVAGTRSPTKTFATLEECIPWCQLFNAAPGVDNTAVVAAVVDLRTR